MLTMLVYAFILVVDFLCTVCMCWGVWSLLAMLFTIPVWSWTIGIKLYVAIKVVWWAYQWIMEIEEELKEENDDNE
jgi:hypothetical protein